MYCLFYNHLEQIFNWRWLNSKWMVNIKAKNFMWQFIKTSPVFIILHLKISFVCDAAYRQNTGSGTQAVPVSQFLLVYTTSRWLSFAEDQDLISFVCIWIAEGGKKIMICKSTQQETNRKYFLQGVHDTQEHNGAWLRGQGAECACLYRYFHLVALMESMVPACTPLFKS